jgi:hypothetical protein
MNYDQWRDELFNHPADSDPVSLRRSDEFEDLASIQAFDFIDRVLVDPEVHTRYSYGQLGLGLYSIFSNCCTCLPALYSIDSEAEESFVDEARRIQGIRHLIHLYADYFERYCTTPVIRVGAAQVDDRMESLCYMFWDIFALYPGNASPGMQAAAIQVMQQVLATGNEQCLVSAIHGLGHWALYLPAAVSTLQTWLQKPTTQNPAILAYGQAATTGRIM